MLIRHQLTGNKTGEEILFYGLIDGWITSLFQFVCSSTTSSCGQEDAVLLEENYAFVLWSSFPCGSFLVLWSCSPLVLWSSGPLCFPFLLWSSSQNGGHQST